MCRNFIHSTCSTVSRRRLRTLSDCANADADSNQRHLADFSRSPEAPSPAKCVSETEEDEDDDDDGSEAKEKVVCKDVGDEEEEDQLALRKKINTLLGPTRCASGQSATNLTTTATSTPSLARTWTCFGCGFRTKRSVTWHCINCERVSYLAPVYKETLPLRDRRRLRQRAARLRAKRSLSMDAAERHLLKCRKCTRDMNAPTPHSPTMIVFPWQERRRRFTSRVSCVHHEQSLFDGHVFGSPIREGGKDEDACGVCGICERQPKEANKTTAVNEPRFTITTLARRATTTTTTQTENGVKRGTDKSSGSGGNGAGGAGGGSGAGFLIAVKDWLLPSGGVPRRPQRRLDSGGGYQVIRKNLLNPRAQPVYNNEFHLTPLAVKEEQEEEQVVAITAGVAQEAVMVVGAEPVYAVVNKAGKTKYKNPIAATKYSFLTDTLSRKPARAQEATTVKAGEAI